MGDQSANWREEQRRLDATIAKASTCHMSNAKWRKLFSVFEKLNVSALQWKFVRDDRIYTAPVPLHREEEIEGAFGDSINFPYIPFREIEWIEVASDRSAEVVSALAAIGQFPIQELDSGIRIVGYSW